MPDVLNGKLSGTLSQTETLRGTLSTRGTVSGSISMGTNMVSVRDYNLLYEETMPQINNVTLKGNKISSELHVQHEMDAMSYQDIDDILFG